jgi:hypothetical protein
MPYPLSLPPPNLITLPPITFLNKYEIKTDKIINKKE